jgi:hypothetical protein
VDETPKKSHTLRNVILIVLVLLLVGGVVAYFINENNKKEAAQKAEQAAAAKAEKEQQQAENAKEFAAIANSGEPYVATIDSNAGGKQVNGVITSDGQGNTSYVYTADGSNVTLIYTKDAYYLCNGNATCIKYPASQSASSGFDPSTYQFDGTKLNEFKNSANYKGQEACPAPATGTCDVWSVSTANGGATSTFYVNAETKRIARVTVASGTTNSQVTYDYKNATVTVPTNFTEVPAQ